MANYPQNQRFNKPFLNNAFKKSDHGSGLAPHRALLWCGAQRTFNWLLDVIFPKTCLGCGKFTADADFDYVCRKCFSGISFRNTFECIGCKRQTKLGLTCVSCRNENSVDRLIIAAELSDPLVEKILKTYKYKFMQDMAVSLSVVVKKCVKKLLLKGFILFEDNSIIIPVPLHKKRLNWRGFNQAGLLAGNMADTYFVRYVGNVLAKITNSKHQADTKAREERLNNVKGNFVVTDDEMIRGRTIILVDDICTTGATLNECAKVLKASGAKRVIGFVIARGQFKN